MVGALPPETIDGEDALPAEFIDIYQGCELWDFSLVDPDNRRSAHFDLRRRLLASLVASGRRCISRAATSRSRAGATSSRCADGSATSG